MVPRLLCPLVALHSQPLPQFSPRLQGSACGRCLLMCFQKNSSWKGPKGLTTWISREDSLVFPTALPLLRVVRLNPGFHQQGSAGRGLLGSRAFGSVRRTAAEPSRYGRVGVITALGQLPLFANFATSGYPAAGREGGGERELERKQTPPPPQSSPQAAIRGFF